MNKEASNSLDKLQGGISGSDSIFRAWIYTHRAGIWISLVVIALIGGRWLQVKAGRPAHRQEIAAAFGSVKLFYGVPQMNHDGSQFTYVTTAAKGYALFLCEAATGRKQVISVQTGWGAGNAFDLHAWPWSPDDSAFIYTAQNQLFICPADAKKNDQPTAIPVHEPSDIVWLNPLEFVWREDGVINDAKKLAAGGWKIHKLHRNREVSCLTAVDANTIAWLEQNCICRLTLTNDAEVANDRPATSRTNTQLSLLVKNDLALWLDASTLQQSDGTPVTELADLSPGRNSAVVNRNPPVFTASDNPRALNKKGTIHFISGHASAEATGLKTNRRLGIAGSHPRTIFAVMRRRAGGQSMLIGQGDTRGSGTYFGMCDQVMGISLPGGWGYYDNLISPPPSLKNGWNILGAVYDGTSQKGFINGILKGTSGFKLDTADTGIELGLRTGANEESSDGDFAELLIYDRALDFSECRQVEDYLGEKWFGMANSSDLVWCDPKLEGIEHFSYSTNTGQFLIHQTDSGFDTLWRYDSGSERLFRLVKASSLYNETWTAGNEFAYASRTLGHEGLILANPDGTEKKRQFAQGNIDAFAVSRDGGKLMMLGIATNEPSPGIWQYDLASGQIQASVPCSDYSSEYAKKATPLQGAIMLPSGRAVGCTIYRPGNFNWHKKYPLVMGDTVLSVAVNGDHGRLWLPAIASCGAFVVVINRGSWGGGIDQWEENVLGVYQSMIRDPCVDARHVYLFGASAETTYLSACLEKTPALWQGAIFLNPGRLPDFSQSPPSQPRPKILISAGGEEHQDDRLKKHQVSALQAGSMEEIIIHPDEQHHLVGNDAQLERTKAIMHFIFEE